MSGPASLFLFAASAFAPSCLLVVPVPYMAPVSTVEYTGLIKESSISNVMSIASEVRRVSREAGVSVTEVLNASGAKSLFRVYCGL